MSKNEQEERIYTGADDKMVETSKTIRDAFHEDKADFVNFDEDFTDPYETDYTAAIDVADGVVKNETVNDQLTQLSDAVEVQMVFGRKHYQTAKYFIEKAFPKQPLIWNEFGFDNYLKCRNSQSKMIGFMKNLHGTMTKYSAQLIAKKYTQAKIDETLSIKIALDAANSAQENFKKVTPQMTYERIGKLNSCWAFTSQVAKAGKIIFEDNYGKYQKYVLNEVNDTEPDEEDQPPANPGT